MHEKYALERSWQRVFSIHNFIVFQVPFNSIFYEFYDLIKLQTINIHLCFIESIIISSILINIYTLEIPFVKTIVIEKNLKYNNLSIY